MLTTAEASAVQVLARVRAAGGLRSESGLRAAYLSGVIDEEQLEAGLDSVLRGIDSPQVPVMLHLPRRTPS